MVSALDSDLNMDCSLALQVTTGSNTSEGWSSLIRGCQLCNETPSDPTKGWSVLGASGRFQHGAVVPDKFPSNLTKGWPDADMY